MRCEPGIGAQPAFCDGVPLFEREHLEELPRLDAAEFAGAESGAVDPPDACRVRDADAPPQDCVWRGVGVRNCHGTDGATEFGDGRRDGIGATLHLLTSTLRDLTAGSGLSFERRAQLEAAPLGRQLELDAAR